MLTHTHICIGGTDHALYCKWSSASLMVQQWYCSKEVRTCKRSQVLDDNKATIWVSACDSSATVCTATWSGHFELTQPSDFCRRSFEVFPGSFPAHLPAVAVLMKNICFSNECYFCLSCLLPLSTSPCLSVHTFKKTKQNKTPGYLSAIDFTFHWNAS